MDPAPDINGFHLAPGDIISKEPRGTEKASLVPRRTIIATILMLRCKSGVE
jgi:hypothetical protein